MVKASHREIESDVAGAQSLQRYQFDLKRDEGGEAVIYIYISQSQILMKVLVTCSKGQELASKTFSQRSQSAQWSIDKGFNVCRKVTDMGLQD